MSEADTDVRRDAGRSHEDLTVDDTGREALLAVYERLQIDAAWTVWHDDGFTWWAHRLPQRIRVEGPTDVDGLATRWLSFETAALRGVAVADGAKSNSAAIAAMELNRVSNLYEVHLDGDRLGLRGRVYFMPETLRFRTELFADRALLAVTWAERNADTLVGGAGKLSLAPGLAVDATPHPTSGERAAPDDMLNVADAVFQPLGQEPPRNAGATDLRGAAEVLAGSADDVVGGSDEGLVQASLSGTGVAARVAIRAQIGHPSLGQGMLLLVYLRPPALDAFEPGSREEGQAAIATAETLNQAAWSMPWPLLHVGAWVGDGGSERPHRVVYASFHPNATLTQGVAEALAYDGIGRAHRAAPLLIARDGRPLS